MDLRDTFGHRPGLKLQPFYNSHVELSKEFESPFSIKYYCLMKWTCILEDQEDQVFILFLVLKVPSNGDQPSPLDATDVGLKKCATCWFQHLHSQSLLIHILSNTILLSIKFLETPGTISHVHKYRPVMFLIDTSISLRLLIHFVIVCYDGSGVSTPFNMNYHSCNFVQVPKSHQKIITECHQGLLCFRSCLVFVTTSIQL